MYKHLLFDADNTLLDFNEGERCALRGALSSSPLEFSEDVYKRYHEINDGLWKKLELGEVDRVRLRTLRFEILFEEYGFNGSDYGQFMDDIYINEISKQSQLIDGAEDVVRSLAEKYELYIVTNASVYVQRKRLAKTFFSECFKKYYISEEIGATKPQKEFFDKVIADIGDDRSSYLVIGDSLSSDIKGAMVSGLDSCYIDRCGRGAEGYTPKYIIRDLRELLDIL